MLDRLDIRDPDENGDKKIAAKALADSVNVERLGNNPVALDYDALYGIYLEMIKNEATRKCPSSSVLQS